jgi:peptidoglycan-associated lipoprotein
MKKLVISIVLVNLLAACASEKPQTPAEAAPAPVATATAAAPSTVPVAGAPVAATSPARVARAPVTATSPARVAGAPAPAVTSASVAAVDSLNDQTSILTQRSVYYPFDVSAVQEDDKPVIVAHAKYLSEHPERKARVEGNCDERGSNEYNLALGQRRADGVKQMLVLGGAKASQIESISYGEEKPSALGHDETSWSQNRRSDIKY